MNEFTDSQKKIGIGASLVLGFLYYWFFIPISDTSYSSFIQEAEYTRYSDDLVISIDDVGYKYCDVPESVWNKYRSAESKGKSYNALIKGNYSCVD